MQSLYVEGKTVFHRLPADLKLAALIAVSVGLFLTTRLMVLAGFVVVAGVCYLMLPLTFRQSLARLIPVSAAILFVGLFNLLFQGLEPAAVTVLRLTALMLFAATLTAVTAVPAFIETVSRWAMPLEKAGLLKAADIGLAVGLVIRFVPDILARYGALRDAHRARGIRFSPKSTLVPLIILTLRDADTIADAIDARGIRGKAMERKQK